MMPPCISTPAWTSPRWSSTPWSAAPGAQRSGAQAFPSSEGSPSTCSSLPPKKASRCVSSTGRAPTPTSLPCQGQEGPWQRFGIKGVAKVGRASPVPHLPWCKRTTVRGQACSSAKDQRGRAKCPKGGFPAGSCRHPGSYSLPTGDRGSGSGAGEWMDWETGKVQGVVAADPLPPRQSSLPICTSREAMNPGNADTTSTAKPKSTQVSKINSFNPQDKGLQ